MAVKKTTQKEGALVERFFQLAPGVRNARLGGAGSCLGRFNFFTDSA